MHRLKVRRCSSRDILFQKESFRFRLFQFHFRIFRIYVVSVAVYDSIQRVCICLLVYRYFSTVVYCPFETKNFLSWFSFFHYLAIVAFLLCWLYFFGRISGFCKCNMKSQFCFQLRREVSIISNVPTHPDSKRKIMIEIKYLQWFLQDISNGLICNTFIIYRIHNVKQIYKFFKFINHRVNFLKCFLFLFLANNRIWA